MSNKKHVQHGLGGLRSETTGGWSASQHYIDREPGSYIPPASMTAPCNAKEPTAEVKPKRKRASKKQVADLTKANKTDLRKRNIK